MEPRNTHNTDGPMNENNLQSSHWLPALRPNDLDDNGHSPPISDSLETGRIADLVSIETSTVPKSKKDAPNNSSGPEESKLNAEETIALDAPDPSHLESTPNVANLEGRPDQGSGQVEEDETLEEEDDERLDPSWGFKRMSTAQILGSVDRSTTFPSFDTPAKESSSYFDNMEEPAQNISESTTNTATALVDPHLAGTTANSVSHNNMVPEEELERTPIGASGQGLKDVSDTRFEEGVPLMLREDPDDAPEKPFKAPTALNQFDAWGDADGDASFFNSEDPITSTAPDAPGLKRKSTSMVVNSLHVHLKPEQQESQLTSDSLPPSASGNMQLRESLPDTEESAVESRPADAEDVWKAMADDEEFLVEDADDLLPDSEPGSPSSFIASLQESDAEQTQPQGTAMAEIQQTPPTATRLSVDRQTSSNPYAPHQPSTSELAQLSPTTYGNVGLSRPGLGPMNSFQSHLQQMPTVPRAESFADQAKGGYKSPYDLPMELSKPRKRPAVPQLAQTTKPVPPPPRTSSMSDKQLQSPFTPSAPIFPPAPPHPSYPVHAAPQQRSSTASVPPPSSVKPKSGTSSFFEELPIVTKPRSGSGGGRYTPQQPQAMPLQLQPQSAPVPLNRAPQPQPSPPRQADPYAQFQLRPPERVDPFTNAPIQPAIPQAPAALSNRYSPAPPATLLGPRTGPSPRYSPAPPAQQTTAGAANRYVSQPAAVPLTQPPHLPRTISQPPPTQPTAVPTLPFQPRTSSPLAHHKSSMDASASAVPENTFGTGAIPSPQYNPAAVTSPPATSVGPPSSTYQSHFYSSPPKAIAPDGILTGPRRSQTQSPSKQRPRPAAPIQTTDVFARPASAHGQMSPVRSHPHVEHFSPGRPSLRGQSIAEELVFLEPNDETRHDSFQRWKGAPVFHFGFGGTVVSTFPKHIPRYSAGAVRPQIKAAVGELSIRGIKDILQLPEHLSSFPGPLRTKSKKKDVVAWISNLVTTWEMDTSTVLPSQALPDPRKRHQEKILLWRIMKSLVEHDGVLDGNGDALKSVNQILSPEVYQLDDATASRYREDMVISPSATYRPTGAALKADSTDPMAMQTLRKHLLKGARQEAVWYAVDNRLWSHALLIASTLTRDVWRQVVQEFVKLEVRTAGESAESLSAVYEIFGGNLDESIDQLVPPSARAGLQMVSKVENGGSTKNALDGLDKWRETLGLVINNRSPGDHGALLTLGRLLQDYGRTEAAHICYLFARNPSTQALFGGADEPLTSVVLLGVDHKKQPFDFARDHEAILLTEVYEFATLVLPGSATTFLPYLSAYKLQRAVILADAGFKAEAQAYCDAITATMKSSKAPAYYHNAFLGELEDFSNRLTQVPVPSSGSWIAKPSIEKVSGSVWNKFSSFVAGDDSDADSKGSGRDAIESGPFAKLAGTPSLSRHGSQSDIYGSYPAPAPGAVPIASTMAGSRYAPNGLMSARSSSELIRGRPSLDSQRSPPGSSHAHIPRPSPYDPVNMLLQSQMSPPANPYQSLSFGASRPTNRYQATPPQSSYMPNTISEDSPSSNIGKGRQEAYIPTPPPEQPPMLPYDSKPVEAPETMAPTSDSPAFGGFVPPAQAQFDEPASVQSGFQQDAAYEPLAQSYGYGYDPPADTGYTPYVPEADSPEEAKPKKKSYLDDDDDFSHKSNHQPTDSSASNHTKSLTADEKARRAANDAAADAAFRAAAEADAAAASEKEKEKKSQARSSGWFGGWLGGNKKSDSLDGTTSTSTDKAASQSKGAEQKVYRAKLGESKMKLYYDEKLKKWVNPDNPDAATKATATPPPPRMGSAMGPPRSANAAPPTSSPALGAGPPMGQAQASVISPALVLGNGGSGPPSRVGTPAAGGTPGTSPGIAATLPPNVNASLAEGGGGAGGGLGAGLGLAPPSRPSTATSNASSIDDLLGAPGAGGGRKSVKGKKGKGRYVDVMAK